MAPKRSKQTQLSFTPGEDLSFSSSQRISPPSTRQQPRREAFVDKKKPPADEDVVYDTGESVSEDEGEVDRLQLAKEVATGRAQESSLEDDGEEDDEPEQEVQQAKKGKKRALVISSSDDDEQPVASTSKRQPSIHLNDEDLGSPISETEFSSPVKPSSSAVPRARPPTSSQTVIASPTKKKGKGSTFEGVYIDLPSPRRGNSKSASPAVSVGAGAKGKGKTKEQKEEKGKSKLSSMLLDDEASETSEEEEEHRFAPRVNGEGKRRAVVVQSSEDEDEEEQPRKPSKKQSDAKGTGKTKGPAQITLADSSDSEAPSQPTRRRKPITATTSKKRAHPSSPMPSPPPPPRSSPSKKRKILTASQKRRARDGTPESGTEDDGSDSEDGWLVKDEGRIGEKDKKGKSQTKGKGKEKAAAEKPKSKKLKRRRDSTTPPIASDEESDFTDDDDLSLSGKETLQENRLRTIKSPGTKGSKFEMLRRLRAEKESEKQLAADRARRRIVDSDDSDNGPTPGTSSQLTSTALKKKRALTASYLGAEVPSSSSQSGSEEEESEESSDGGKGGRGKGSTNWERESDLDRDEEGFIVEEDEDEEGMKVVNEYRERVTVKAQGMMYFLKTYLQFLVHLIVCPQVDWLAEDNAFKSAHDAIDDNLKGLTQSLIGSAAWKAPFKKALDERPIFHLFDLDGIDRAAACDACTMGKSRHSIYSGSLSGPYYDRKTFRRPVLESDSDSSSDEEDDSDEDSDSDDSAVSAEKRETEKDRKQKMDNMDNTHQDFNLGSSCAGRAQVYHELHHWGWTTHERLQEQMTKLKIQKKFPKVDGLNRMSVKDRKKAIRQVVERQRKEADRCAARMDEEGVIARFAKKLEDEIQKARQAFATNKN